ncbi:TetR/AcrR family transcriptional regulator [Actinomadura sp. BRA 177]|uniref:TetR/AcrR family transcriptional regulator n=1 Tax=Actinomadura sp. BRA 177 TaxID=2745202 RepID=UPI0015960916|nr:TetR/AcrR family transcriptional regulator [Actinomadura sp. BRA 177]NVI89713.1 TetR/AcrR family transcriptional regulator [Actinomadura sp. BRA 177]
MDRGAAGGRRVDLELMRTPQPKERADAARNRVKVLDAAAELFARHGVESVSMDAVAAAAGVGKGTLFRRFGDKAGLAAALLNRRERDLQNEILSGSPPLGPGQGDAAVSPSDRMHAFADAYLDYVLDHLSLVRMAETASPGARYRIGAYGFWHRHLTILLDQMGETVPDGEATAHALLAVLGAEHLTAMVEGVGRERARAAVHTVFQVADG